MDKKELRKIIRSHEGPLGDSGKVMEKIETISGFLDSDIVLLYCSIPGEVETARFIRKWAAVKTVALPRVVGDNLEIREYRPDGLVAGYRGISEPSEEAPLIDASEIGFAVIPGVAFDSAGHRLGRGKGYYDRLLPSLNCLKAGVAFDHQLVAEVPVEEHDISMDMVFTPNYSYLCTDLATIKK